MRRFTFKLEPALRLRRGQEEQAELELARRRRRLAEEEAHLEELRREQERHETARAEMQRRKMEIQNLVEADRYGSALHRARWLQEQRVEEARAEVQRALEALKERRIDRETLERLRERRLEEHVKQEAEAEQKTLDEAAVLRWRRS